MLSKGILCGRRVTVEKTILDYIHLIKKRLWLITVFVLISCATTFYVSKNFVVPVYSASGQLLVNNIANVPAGNNLNDLNFSLNLIESYKEILKSPTIMKEVVSAHPEFGLTEEKLAKKLQIKSSDKSQVINLSVEDENYTKAAGIVNSVSQIFIRSLPSLMKLDNVTLLTPADPADTPVPSNSGYLMNIVISFVVSLMAALGIILLMETLNSTLRSEKEAEVELGLPIIASIPAIRKRDLSQGASANERVGEGAYAAAK
jgi:capsular polysaccharide biosynthesis protein